MIYCFQAAVILALFLSIGCQNTPDRDSTGTPTPFTPFFTPTFTSTPTPILPTPTPTPTATPTPFIDRAVVFQKYFEGSRYMQEGKYDEAVDAFIEAHNAKPDSALICSSAADALFHSGMVEHAVSMALRAVEIDSDHIDAHKILAQCYLSLQEGEKAVEQYRILLKHEPESLDYLTQLANVYISLQQQEKAVPLYRKIIRQSPPQVEFYQMHLALLLYNLERYTEALAEYKIIVETLPESFEAHFQLGSIYQHLGQDNDAIDAYLIAFTNIHSPLDELLVRRKLAEIYQKRGALREAAFQYEKIKELSPDDIDASMQLVTLYTDQGDEEAALEQINLILNEYPDEIVYHEIRFDVLSHFGKEKEGYLYYLETFDRLIQERKHVPIQQLLGIILLNDVLDRIKKNNLQDSLQHQLEQYGEFTPKPVHSFFAELFFYNWSGNQNKIQTNQQELILTILQANRQNNIDTVESICNEFISWNEVRRTFLTEPTYTELKTALHSCAEMFPSLSEASRVLGLLATDQLDWHTAEFQFRKTLSRLEPGTDLHKEVLFELVWAYDNLNRIADMEELLGKAKEIYPDEANVYNSLGYMYADRNIHLEKALRLIEKALKLDPNDPNIMDSMGWVYFRLKRYQDALNMLKRAFELDGGHPVIAMHLGDAYDKIGDSESALIYWEHALEHSKDYPWEFPPEKIKTLQDQITNAK